MPALTRNPFLTVAILTLAAAALYSVNLGAHDMPTDERVSYLYSQSSFGRILDIREDPTHTPVYYLALKLWVQMAGSSDAGLRSLSVLFTVAAVPVVYAIGRRLGGGHGVGLLTLLVFIPTPMIYHLAQEARSYPMLVFLGAIAAWCTLEMLLERDMSLQKWTALRAGFTAACLAMVALHQGMLFWVPYVVAIGALPAFVDWRRLVVAAGIGLLALAIYAVTILPYLVNAVTGMPDGYFFSLPLWWALVKAGLMFAGGKWLPLAGIPTLIAAGVALRVWGKAGDWNRVVFVAVTAFLPVLVMCALFAAGAFGEFQSFHTRYFIVILPVLSAAVAYGICRMGRRWGALAMAFLLICNAVGIAFNAQGGNGEPVKRAVAIVLERSADDARPVMVMCGIRNHLPGSSYGGNLDVLLYSKERPLTDPRGDGRPHWGIKYWMAPEDTPAAYRDLWMFKATADGCPSVPDNWGPVIERYEMPHDDLHLWHLLRGGEKRHTFWLDRYRP